MSSYELFRRRLLKRELLTQISTHIYSSGAEYIGGINQAPVAVPWVTGGRGGHRSS